MAKEQASVEARQIVGTVKATMILALAGVTGLSVSGQAQREWRDYAGGPDSSRFVAAKQITKANVRQLQVAWTYPPGQTDFNPLVVRGVVYGRGANGSFVALDAATGKEIWIHEGVQGFNGRGVNYWESKDGKDRRLIFSANNILQEIDARTGQSIPSFGVDGRVDLRVGLDRDPATVNQQSRTPGRVFENLIILGSATNQEYASAPGDIRAFDVRTGALVWTFHTVPRPGEFGYDTWPEDAWKTVGGANNWARAVDRREARHRLRPDRQPQVQLLRREPARAPTSSATASSRSTCRTGKRLWHFQTVHHDIWDLDNNSAPQLTTIRQNGRTDRRRRHGQQDRLPLRLRSRHRHSRSGRSRNVPCRRRRPCPAKCSGRRSRFPTKPAAVLPPEVHGGRPESAHPDAGGARAVQAAHPEGEKRRALHADWVRRSDSHARQSGRIELGQHGGQSDGRQRLRHRLQRADDHSPPQAGRDARRARRRRRPKW